MHNSEDKSSQLSNMRISQLPNLLIDEFRDLVFDQHPMHSLTSCMKGPKDRSKIDSKLKKASDERQLLKIRYTLHYHFCFGALKARDVQILVHRAFKYSHGIQQHQSSIIDILQLLFRNGMNVNIKDSKQRSVLQIAVTHRLTQVIDFLINCHVDLTECDSFGNSILHFLVTNEACKLAKQLKVKKVSPSYLKPVKKQIADFISWMVLKGFNVDSQNKNGDTALHLAAKYNLLFALPPLLEHSKNNMIYNNCDMNVFQILLYSVSNKIRNFRKDSHSDATYISIDCYERSFIDEIYEKFIDKGFSLNIPDNDGFTPVHHLLMQHRTKLVKAMLDRFTYINACDKYGNTALHIVMKNLITTSQNSVDYREIARILISKGANIYLTNKIGNSPLIAAAVYEKESLLKEFIKYGANLQYQYEGRNLLHYICKSKIGMDSKSCREAFKYLINQGLDVNAKDVKGKTPLHYAVQCGRTKTSEALIECGANVNARESFEGNTPLHEAVIYKHKKLIKVLVKKGANINAATYKGQTVLNLVNDSKTKLKETLIKLGACTNVQNNNEVLPVTTTILHEDYSFGSNINSDVHVLDVKHDKSTDASITGNQDKLVTDHKSFDKKLRGFLKKIKSKKNYKANNRKSLYNLLHINRNSKGALYKKNKKLKKLIKLSNVKKLLLDTWLGRGTKKLVSVKNSALTSISASLS